ncbi:MAG: tetratricopeptide repeat protein [Geminicoccaceae bacterium]
MNRCRGLAIALVAALLLPASAFAQKNEDNDYTEDAGKLIGVAMLQQDTAQRNQYYRDALVALQEGMQEEPDNARIWFIAGQAHAGLHHFEEADAAFDKVVELFPDLAADVDAEREAGWLEGFQAGVALMDADQNEQAIAVLQASHELYPHRPEGLLNIGSIYANQGQTDQAIEAFEQAIVAARGPHLEKLDSTGQAQWAHFAEMAEMNIAQMTGAAGVENFQQGNYDEAAAAFTKAAEINPYSRDYLFNIVQAHYAKAQDLEEQRDSTAEPGSAPQDQELIQIYQALGPEIEKVREFDPNNETLLYILARSERRLGELSGNEEAGQQKALAALRQLEALPVEVQELIITPGEQQVAIEGKVKNRTLEPGSPVTIQITLLGSTGEPIGETTATATAGAKDEIATFQATADITAQLAGWKYQVAN